MKITIKQYISIWAILLVMSLTAPVLHAKALPQENEQKINEINQILRDNPQVIHELHKSLKDYIDQQNQFNATLQQNSDYLYNNLDHPFYGAENPKLTIVFFTDYSCPWCKKLTPVLQQLVEKYPEIKVIEAIVPLKELNSEQNSGTYALNTWQNNPEKFAEVSELLLKKPGSHTPESLLQVANKTKTHEQLGEVDKTQQQVIKNYQLFVQLGLQGTPAMLIGDQVIPGYLTITQLEPIIQAKLNK